MRKEYIKIIFFVLMGLLCTLMTLLRFAHFPDTNGNIASAWQVFPYLVFALYFFYWLINCVKNSNR